MSISRTVHRGQESQREFSLPRPQERDHLISRRLCVAWYPQPAEVGLELDGQRLVTSVRARHAVESVSQLDQHQLSLAHVPKTRGEAALLADLLARFDKGAAPVLQLRLRISRRDLGPD